MKIAFNPSTVAALTTPPNNKDITFDLRGRNIFAQGVTFYGTDTNTWRDIKINNVSIGSNTLDLRNGGNTTLNNTDGVVTINSTWRPVVDNLTSDSTTSSLSANQGKVLKALIDGKSNSDHNHDGRYLRLNGEDTMQGNLYLHSHGTSYIGRGWGDRSGEDFAEANIVIRSWWGISFKSYDDIVRTYIDTRTGNIGTKGVLNAVGAVIQGRVYNDGDDEGIIIHPASNGSAGLILGTHNGERSVFYLNNGQSFWRYNNGSTNLDIYHPKKSGTIALTSDIPNPTNYYWANVKISASSSTTTSPIVSNLTATNSIRMNNISLEHTDEINNITNGGIYLNQRSSGNVNLCYGGGNVGIGIVTPPSYKLDVNGQMRASGFHHSSVNSDNYILLAGGGYQTLKDFIFLNKSYNYTDNEHYNLAFRKLSGICNNLVWVDGHVKGYITKSFAIDPAVFPYRYDNDSALNTIYLMTENSYITITAMGGVTINNTTNHKQRVGFFYTGRA